MRVAKSGGHPSPTNHHPEWDFGRKRRNFIDIRLHCPGTQKRRRSHGRSHFHRWVIPAGGDGWVWVSGWGCGWRLVCIHFRVPAYFSRSLHSLSCNLIQYLFYLSISPSPLSFSRSLSPYLPLSHLSLSHLSLSHLSLSHHPLSTVYGFRSPSMSAHICHFNLVFLPTSIFGFTSCFCSLQMQPFLSLLVFLTLSPFFYLKLCFISNLI